MSDDPGAANVIYLPQSETPQLEDYERPTTPHPDAVDGAALLNEIVETFNTYTVMPLGAAEVCALWTMATHALREARFQHAPRLIITAATPDSGKSTLLTLLVHLVANPEQGSGLTEAALFRTINESEPTIIIDESDLILPRRGSRSGLLRVLNSGHYRPQAYERRAEYDRESKTHVTVRYSTFAMCALAGLGERWIEPTLRSRSFLIALQPKMPHEEVADFHPDDHGPDMRRLRSMIKRWVLDNLDALRRARPSVDGLHNRAADNAKPLLAVADVVGGVWPQRAREAIKRLTPPADDDPRMLLCHIGEILRDRDEPPRLHKVGVDGDMGRIFTTELCDRLTARIDWPYEKLNQWQLAERLRPFGVLPRQSQEAGRGSRKQSAFWLCDFVQPFARYGIPPAATGRPVDGSGSGSTGLPVVPAAEDAPEGMRRQAYTDPEFARLIVEHFAPQFGERSTFLDPARGRGAFFDHLPSPRDWCEIDPDVLPAGVPPRDFHDWCIPVDWIITNPVWPSGHGDERGYREFAQHAFSIADNVVFLVKSRTADTQSRRRDWEAAGFGFAKSCSCRGRMPAFRLRDMISASFTGSAGMSVACVKRPRRRPVDQ